MNRVWALGAALALAGCGDVQPGATPETPSLQISAQKPGAFKVSTKLPVDITWSRIGGARHSAVRSAEDLTDFFNSHPRLNGGLFYDVGSLANRGLGSIGANAAAPEPVDDWNLPQKVAVSVSPALLIDTATAANDRMFVHANTSANSNFIRAYSNIHGTAPTLVWSQAIDSAINGGALTFNATGDTLYATSTNGTVYALDTADTSSQRVRWSQSVGSTIAWSAPWVSFDEPTEAVYVADEGSHLTKFNAATGAQISQALIDGTFGSALHTMPVAFNGMVWIAADNGRLYRLNTSLVQVGLSTALYTATNATAADAVWSTPFFDTLYNKIYVGVNNRLMSMTLDLTSGTGCVQTAAGAKPCTVASTTFNNTTGNKLSSSVYVDQTTGQNFIYLGARGRVYRWPYTVAGSTVTIGSPANVRIGAGNTTAQGNWWFPRSSPAMVPGGKVFIGDADGNFARITSTNSSFAIDKRSTSFADPAGVTVTGVRFDATVVFDFTTTNSLYVGCGGTSSGGNAGAYIQLPITF